jgi:polysaccharide export outer membrane protein
MLSRLLVFFVLAASLAGCASTPYSQQAFVNTADVPYHLAAGDKLRVLVFGQDNLSNIYMVSSTGHISMPLIGDVPAAGLTTDALAASVAQRLRAGFVRDPNVAIEVEQYRPFFVLGEVTQSGQFP